MIKVNQNLTVAARISGKEILILSVEEADAASGMARSLNNLQRPSTQLQSVAPGKEGKLFRLLHIDEISLFFFGKRYVKKLRKPFYLMFPCFSVKIFFQNRNILSVNGTAFKKSGTAGMVEMAMSQNHAHRLSVREAITSFRPAETISRIDEDSPLRTFY